ncbi:hypothetical protein PSQ40_06580 [Curvibacter sp. HBC61]|uniref:DUF3618 domain-containing protein n=1 Tax=Curvibacter cyanobacteriorum TaxID=3026422 RepID=A0ABT5MVZ8_9BURK|nr:hypothetical protein [Curvibacter sp. HBC61]MDD0838231.1 hypothetical protein [Curvibacter sp. HBC61]
MSQHPSASRSHTDAGPGADTVTANATDRVASSAAARRARWGYRGDLAPALSPQERKGQLLERIERQRLMRQTRRIQAAIAALQAEAGQASGDAGRGGAQRSGLWADLAGLVGRGAQAGATGASGTSGDGFPRSQLMRSITQQPLLAAGVLGVLLMVGPRRLARVASWVLPLVLRRMG